MNALISAFKDKQKIMFANEGRLLKKSFFGILILALAFQTGEFGDVVRQSMVDAYLGSVSFCWIYTYCFYWFGLSHQF